MQVGHCTLCFDVLFIPATIVIDIVIRNPRAAKHCIVIYNAKRILGKNFSGFKKNPKMDRLNAQLTSETLSPRIEDTMVNSLKLTGLGLSLCRGARREKAHLHVTVR